MLNKQNSIRLQIAIILALILYFSTKAISKFKDEPSKIFILSIITAFIGFSIALFKLINKLKNEKPKDKPVMKARKHYDLTKFLNLLGVVLVIFMFITKQFELIPSNYFVFIYIFTSTILLAIIILNFLKKRKSQQ